MSKKVLLIDDEEKLVANLKVFLELNGYQVLTAFNGKQGLDVARAQVPDIIVTDIMMPEMDGYTLLKEFKMDRQLQNVPVVMLTAKDGLNDLCEIEGAAEFIPKPFDLNRLLDVIKQHTPTS